MYPMTEDKGYRRLVTPKGNIVRMKETEISIPNCVNHPQEFQDTIKNGIWKGTIYCTKCLSVIKVNESSWKDNPLESHEETRTV